MNASSKVLFLLASAVFFTACSQDEGDGKEEKSKAVSAQSLSQSTVQDEVRNQCYRDLLKTSPELINELKGQNPFLLKTWDQTDFSNSAFLIDIVNCRKLQTGP